MIQHRVVIIEASGMVTSKAFNDRSQFGHGTTPGNYIDAALSEVPKADEAATLTIHYSKEDL